MLPTCKQVSEQLSENIDTPISGLRWLAIKLHLLMCFYCRRYSKQLDLTVKTINLLEQTHKTQSHCPSEKETQQALQNYRKHHADN